MFDGPVPISSHGRAWSGYGVVQAKHRQRPDGGVKDADWLIQQVKKEFLPWISGKRITRKPEYYVLATNVRLTAYPGAGGHDRVHEQLEEQRQALGLAGFVVWDAGVLTALLEEYSSIRRTYAAWITPGDVLSALLDDQRVAADDVAGGLATNAAKEMLARQRARLDQAGDAGDHAVSLSSVFVDAPVSVLIRPSADGVIGAELIDDGYVHPESALANILGEFVAPGQSTDVHQGQATEETTTEQRDPWERVEKTVEVDVGTVGLLVAAGNRILRPSVVPQGRHDGNWVIVGGPGQGKSTLGQFLCQLYRAAILSDHHIRNGMPELVRVVDATTREAEAENVPVVRARRWPLHIPLAALADGLASGQVSSILQFAAARSGGVMVPHLRRWLKLFPWCVVLDGLDEVPASSNRKQLMKAIDDFRIEAAAADADILLIATTRPQGYNDDFAPAYFHHISLRSLPEDTARRYSFKLAAARYSQDVADEQSLKNRLRSAVTTEPTKWLMSTPLQVTIMTLLLSQIGEVPTDRYTLFRQYYETIYRRELGKDIATSRLLRDHRANVDALHGHVGLLLQARSERTGETESLLSLNQTRIIVSARLADEGFLDEEVSELANQLVGVATDRLVFLVGSTDEEIGFELRSLQEYCAAMGLLDGPPDQTLARLATIATSPHWRNVMLLACGRIFADQQAQRDLVITFCQELNGTDAPGSDDQGVVGGRTTFAGSQLAADLLADGVAYGQPRYRRLLLREATQSLRMPASPSHATLARLCMRDDLATALYEIFDEYLDRENPYDRLGVLGILTMLANSLRRSRAKVVLHLKRASTEALSLYAKYALSLSNTSLLSLCSRSLLDVSPSELISVIRSAGSLDVNFVPQELLARLPEDSWVFAVIAVLTREHGAWRRVKVGTLAGTKFDTKYLPVEQEPDVPHEFWHALIRIPDDAMHWLWLREVAMFGIEPTLERLNTAVSEVKALDLDSADLTTLLALLPWPIAHAVATGTDFVRTLTRGPSVVDQWYLNEDSWHEVHPDSIAGPTANRFFPLAGTEITDQKTENSDDIHCDGVLADVAVAALRGAPKGSVARGRRAYWLLSSIPSCTAAGLSAMNDGWETIEKLSADAARIGFLPIGWAASREFATIEPRLDAVGRLPVVLTYSSRTNCCISAASMAAAMYAEQYFRDPRTWPGLGRIAEALHDVTLKEPLSFFSPQLSVGCEITAAAAAHPALTISLAARAGRHEEAHEALDSDTSWASEHLRSGSVRWIVDYPPFAVALARQSPDESTRTMARSVLRRLISEAPTRLLDAAVTKQLRLPPLTDWV